MRELNAIVKTLEVKNSRFLRKLMGRSKADVNPLKSLLLNPTARRLY